MEMLWFMITLLLIPCSTPVSSIATMNKVELLNSALMCFSFIFFLCYCHISVCDPDPSVHILHTCVCVTDFSSRLRRDSLYNDSVIHYSTWSKLNDTNSSMGSHNCFPNYNPHSTVSNFGGVGGLVLNRGCGFLSLCFCDMCPKS